MVSSVDLHHLRLARADRRGQVAGIAHDVGGVSHSGRARAGDDLDEALHAGRAMAGDRAEVGELAGLVGEEGEGGRGVLADHQRRPGIVLVDEDVVLGALAVDQVDLHELALIDGERRIRLAFDGASDADVDHPAAGDPGTQREDQRRVIADASRGGSGRGGRRRRFRRPSGLRHLDFVGRRFRAGGSARGRSAAMRQRPARGSTRSGRRARGCARGWTADPTGPQFSQESCLFLRFVRSLHLKARFGAGETAGPRGARPARRPRRLHGPVRDRRSNRPARSLRNRKEARGTAR